MKYYIQDTTTINNKFVYFNKLNELISYFNHLIPRAYGLNRAQYVQNLIDLGHGYDDAEGVTLTQALSEQFNIGIVRTDGKHERTDVHQASRFLKEEYGN